MSRGRGGPTFIRLGFWVARHIREMDGSVGRVIILLRDGRALAASGDLPIGMATLVRNDLRYWLLGTRWLEYLDAEQQVQILRAETIESIDVATQEELS